MFRLKPTKRTKRFREIKNTILTTAFVSLLAISLVVTLYNALSPSSQSNHNGRHLLQIEGSSEDCPADAEKNTPDCPFIIIGADYPIDAFTTKQLEGGAVILHILGLFYMFLAIAIVCDEFFVPAIEVIVEALDLSPDVAGATFMAAGGSAPELFTAFFGTFVSKSSVGFGTIVGSAVFNVLFVIGCCAIFSSGDLVLTWYPFARDSLYYCISLCMLAGFFFDKFIWWYEATILFLMYFGYVFLMIKNAALYAWIDRTFVKTPKEDVEVHAAQNLRPPQSIQTFSVSLFRMMTADAKMSEIAGIHMVSRIKGDVKATFKQVDTDNSGFIEKDELRAVLQKLGGVVNDDELNKCYSELDENDDGRIDFDEFSRWYLRSENRIQADVNQLFSRFDHDNNGYIEIEELENLVGACQGPDDPQPTADEVEAARKILDSNNDGRISRQEFMDWYKSSRFFEAEKQRRGTIAAAAETQTKEEEDEGGVSLAFPSAENVKGRIMYIISAPIVYTLYFTVPDVRKAKWKPWWALAFIASITWLGVYSYFMVWWATVFGRVVGIPDGIMGLTILAAGTSVPDLLTSVLVARQGHGDMAVSSSIGSNIFDVLVGLPLPWIFATAFDIQNRGGSIMVVADSLVLSILILFVMLFAVLAIIYCQKWRMTKTLGYSMFVLYILFCIQDIARQYLN